MPDNYLGYKVRKQLYPSEINYFKRNPYVSGMAAEDKQIIFNPYSKNVDYDAVGTNEAARLFMREKNIVPKFNLTPQQIKYFSGTPYENDPIAMKQTVLSRILSGDPSVGDITPMQQTWGDWLKKLLIK